MHEYEKTYCNPTPLPDYPIGRFCYGTERGYKCDYREAADPTVIYENGVWYLYPSCGMVYISEDFIHWRKERMIPYDIGYAPTVVKHKGKFLLTACSAELYESSSPTGPFKSIGAFRTPEGKELYVDDPMLFSDSDGSLYLYSGCGGEIRGARLDSDNPTRLVTPNNVMFKMNVSEHEWERMGEHNADSSYSWTEGAWMYKRGDIYYLTYSAPGTEWSTYAMGAYKSRSPLGPWKYMETSPFLLTRSGLIRGTGHGSIVDGPRGTVWVFYTCCVCYGGSFERRIGYDPIGFDENGNIIPTSASEIPQYAPGVCEKPHFSNGAGLLPLTCRMPSQASSCAEGRDELYATDSSMLTWWQPKKDDPLPTLTVKISDRPLEIEAVRIIWRDVGMDIKNGVFPGVFGYRVEANDPERGWVCVLDKSDSRVDMSVDYQLLLPTAATDVRITITSKPAGIEPGIIDFTVFGGRRRACGGKIRA